MKKIKIPTVRVALILLGAVLITSHMTAGLSAKFISKSDGDTTARVAHFEAGTIAVGTQATGSFSGDTEAKPHAFVASFDLTFPENEVSREFTLELTMEDASSTFATPSEYKTLASCGGSAAFDPTTVGMAADAALTVGKAYVMVSKMVDGTPETSAWTELATDGTTLDVLAAPRAVGLSAEAYNVKVLFFKTLSGTADTGASISYVLRTEQVD